jgi:hypothetical protein
MVMDKMGEVLEEVKEMAMAGPMDKRLRKMVKVLEEVKEMAMAGSVDKMLRNFLEVGETGKTMEMVEMVQMDKTVGMDKMDKVLGEAREMVKEMAMAGSVGKMSRNHLREGEMAMDNFRDKVLEEVK